MKTKDIKKGISLIVLIITIIVVIILAAVVILTLTKNNPIESAKEARFKEDVRTFQDELALYISKQYANSGGHWDGNISAKSYNQIVEYIPSFTKKYDGKFVINNNNLEYTNKLDEKEKEYAQSLNVREKVKLLPDEFRQVEYIESTGTQYINTRFMPNVNKKYKYCVDFKLVDLSKPKQTVMGNDTKDIRIDDNGYIGGNTENSFIGTNRHNISIEVLKISNNKYSFIEMCDGNEFRGELTYWLNANIAIFTNLSYMNRLSKTKIYSASIYESDILIRNFIPCFSTTKVTDVNGKLCPSGTKGMYDLVEGKFYTNQGTGEDFIPGPDAD